jgi:hypothetical protein
MIIFIPSSFKNKVCVGASSLALGSKAISSRMRARIPIERWMRAASPTCMCVFAAAHDCEHAFERVCAEQDGWYAAICGGDEREYGRMGVRAGPSP